MSDTSDLIREAEELRLRKGEMSIEFWSDKAHCLMPCLVAALKDAIRQRDAAIKHQVALDQEYETGIDKMRQERDRFAARVKELETEVRWCKEERDMARGEKA